MFVIAVSAKNYCDDCLCLRSFILMSVKTTHTIQCVLYFTLNNKKTKQNQSNARSKKKKIEHNSANK